MVPYKRNKSSDPRDATPSPAPIPTMDEEQFRRTFLSELAAFPKVRDIETYLGPKARGGRQLQLSRSTDMASKVSAESGSVRGNVNGIGGGGGGGGDGESYWTAMERLVREVVGLDKGRLVMRELQKAHLAYVGALSVDEIDMMAGGRKS